MKHERILWFILFLVVGFSLAVALVACGDDDDDDDDDDNDDDDRPDPEEVDTLIITSGYGNRYHLFSGDTYEHIDRIEPITEGMDGVDEATIVNVAGESFAVFVSIPEGGGNQELFHGDAFTGENLFQMSSLEHPGLVDVVPYGTGVMFTGVRSGGIPEVLTMDIGGGEPDVYRSSTFTKNIEQYVCETLKWESPDFSPGGVFAAGWHCRDGEGPDTAAFTAVITIEDGESGDDCGSIVWKVENDAPSISDVCFTYDGSMIIFSVGHEAEDKTIYAAKVDEENAQDITADFFDGHVQNFDCDPTSGRIVFNELEVNPNLYVLEYEVSDGELQITSEPTQITEDGEFRRPRWIEN